jgi:hypothetical protein
VRKVWERKEFGLVGGADVEVGCIVEQDASSRLDENGGILFLGLLYLIVQYHFRYTLSMWALAGRRVRGRGTDQRLAVTGERGQGVATARGIGGSGSVVMGDVTEGMVDALASLVPCSLSGRRPGVEQGPLKAVFSGVAQSFDGLGRISGCTLSPSACTEGGDMSSAYNPGRVAGIWYLLLCVIGPLRLIYIPVKLFVRGNAAATVNNIAAHEWLFRLGIVGDLLCGVILIFLVMAFYRLFKGVDQNLAVLVVIFGGVMPALISFVGVVSDAGALIAVRGADFLAVFDKPQRDALAMLFLQLRNQQNTAAEILWGAWLFPLGALVYRSGFLPRFLGVWLIINGCAYVLSSFTGELFPQYQARVFNLSFPALLGELAVMLWLVIKGAKPRPLSAAVPSRAA